MADLSEVDIQRIAAAVMSKMSKQTTALPQSQASDIAAAAARTAVQETMVKGMAMVGIDIANVHQIEALKEDLAFARGLRSKMERVGRSMTTAITNAVTYGFLMLLIAGFVVWLRGQGDPPHGPHIPK